jgi:hypothetical protein
MNVLGVTTISQLLIDFIIMSIKITSRSVL